MINERNHLFRYPAMTKTLGSFKLNVEEGSFTNCEIIVLLGENGTGKTTLIRLLTGDKKCEPDEKSFDVRIPYLINSDPWINCFL